MSNNGQAKLVVSDLQKVERVLEAIRTELESPDLEVFFDGNVWEIVWHEIEEREDGSHIEHERFVTAATLDDAYILARHKAAGTEPAPF